MPAEPAPRLPLTREAYLKLDRASATKHEFFDGSAYAVTGASLAHNRLVRNLLVSSSAALRGKDCEVLPSDLRIRIPGQERYLYPDLSIVCGRHSSKTTRLTRCSTRASSSRCCRRPPKRSIADRSSKAYRAIPSLSEYVLVAQHAARVDHFTRDTERGNWALHPYAGDDTLRFPTIAVELPLAHIYAGVLG